MDSIFIFKIDRIYRIDWIFYIAGFWKKPAICSPLRGTIDSQYQRTAITCFWPTDHVTPSSPTWSPNFGRQTAVLFTVSSGNREKIQFILLILSAKLI